MLQYQFKVIAQHAVANNLLRNAYIKDIAKFSMLAELLLKSGDLPARSLSDCTAQFLQEWPALRFFTMQKRRVKTNGFYSTDQLPKLDGESNSGWRAQN